MNARVMNAIADLQPAPFSPGEMNRDRELVDSVMRIADVLESLHGPMKAYLEAGSSHHVDAYNGAPVSQLLATSPLVPFLSDEHVTDIFINGAQEIYVNRGNNLEKTGVRFPNEKSLYMLASAIAGSVGRTIDPRRPLVDARLKDGSRVNIIAPPMAVDGLSMSIRKFPEQEITLETLIEKGEMSQQLAEFLKLCAQNRISLLISGGTGTGKTTLLNAISRYIPHQERIITIEDTAELRLQQPHVVRLEIKEPQVLGERQDEVNASDLVRNALRMRPNRIIIGEVRGPEAYDMIQALNTGHDGSMTTVHANTPRDALARIENLINERMQNTNAGSIRRQIASSLSLIVHLVYNPNGKRIVSSVTEIVGMEGDVTVMQEIFTLNEGNSKRSTQQWTTILPRHPRLAEAMRTHPLFLPLLAKVQ